MYLSASGVLTTWHENLQNKILVGAISTTIRKAGLRGGPPELTLRRNTLDDVDGPFPLTF